MKSVAVLALLPLALAFPSFSSPVPALLLANTPSLTDKPIPGALIDVSGNHKWVPPDLQAGDMRGVCPGLNALANHNYLPHNGMITYVQGVSVTEDIWGFGRDIGSSGMNAGMAYGGNGTHLSIGGPAFGNSARGALIPDTGGLAGSHNQFEGDSSPTRNDRYLGRGDNFRSQPQFFKQLIDSYDGSDIIGWVLRHKIRRWKHSVSTNPYFYLSPVTMVITILVYCFIGNVLPNGGDFFDEEGLRALFAYIPDANGTLHYHPGFERIPENWHRRLQDFTHIDAAPQFERLACMFPSALLPGGNTGTVNSFLPMDLSNLTNGVYTNDSLFKGNNLRCFVVQVLLQAFPGPEGGSIQNSLVKWMCPQLGKLREEMYEAYPGYRKRT